MEALWRNEDEENIGKKLQTEKIIQVHLNQ